MSEFNWSGGQRPSEQRRVVESTHERDLREQADRQRSVRANPRPGRRPWWRFWTARPTAP